MSRTSTDSDTVSTSDLLDLIQEDDGVNYSDGRKRGPAASSYKSHSHSSSGSGSDSIFDTQRNNSGNASRNYSARLNDNFKSSSGSWGGGQRNNNNNVDVGASRNLSASSSFARRTTTQQHHQQHDSIISNDIFSVRLTSSRRRRVSVDSPDGRYVFLCVTVKINAGGWFERCEICIYCM